MGHGQNAAMASYQTCIIAHSRHQSISSYSLILASASFYQNALGCQSNSSPKNKKKKDIRIRTCWRFANTSENEFICISTVYLVVPCIMQCKLRLLLIEFSFINHVAWSFCMSCKKRGLHTIILSVMLHVMQKTGFTRSFCLSCCRSCKKRGLHKIILSVMLHVMQKTGFTRSFCLSCIYDCACMIVWTGLKIFVKWFKSYITFF